MIEIEINGKKYKAICPVKIMYEGKEYWLKKSTKKNGIYLNNQEPNVLLRDTDNIPK